MRRRLVNRCIPIVIPHVFSKISWFLYSLIFCIAFIAIGNVRRAIRINNTDNITVIKMIDV